MSNIHKQIYERFCEVEPETAKHICEYKPWSSKAIVIWLDGGTAYKIIKDTGSKLIKQLVSADDIRKKYGI